MSKQLREQRAQAHAEGVRALASNNQAAYEKAMAEVDRLKVEIDKSEGRSAATVETRGSNHKRAFTFGKYLRGKQLSEVEMRDVAEGAPMLNHIGTYTGLGFLVPTGFKDQIEQATKWFAPLMDGSVFSLLETDSGNPLPYPVSNDTAQSATIVGEGGAITEQDGAGGNLGANHIVLGAYKLSAGKIKCSLELMQDSAFDLEAWLAERFGERYGRGLEGYLTTGTGSSQPTGLLNDVAASGAVPVSAIGSSESSGGSETGANSIGYSDLVNLEHSVDPSYRRRAKYMFHDSTLGKIKRIIDKFGRPLWAPGISVNEPDTINGYPYVINQSMPVIAPSATTVVFGDLKKFVVRKVSGISVQRLNELYAENGQVGFLSNMRVDSRLIDAGTHPVNTLQQHS